MKLARYPLVAALAALAACGSSTKDGVINRGTNGGNSSTAAAGSSSGPASATAASGASSGNGGSGTASSTSGAVAGSAGATGVSSGASSGSSSGGNPGSSSGSVTCPAGGGTIGTTSGGGPTSCPPGESYFFFQDGTQGCACQVADPAINTGRSSCSYNDVPAGGGQTVCDVLTYNCRLPRDLEPCAEIDGGTLSLCDTGYTCAQVTLDAGAQPTCVQSCTSASDCQNPKMTCGSAGYCVLNTCSSPYQPCDVVGTGDGQCLPYPNGSSGLIDVCTRTGQMAIGQPCGSVGGECQTCAAGAICSTGLSASPRDICLPACDATSGSSMGCSSPEVCVPFGFGQSSSPNPGVCEPQATSSPDAGDAMGGSSTYPASHPAFPQVPNNGGPVMSSPIAVVITYNDYTNTSQANRAAIEAFMSQITTSTWLSTVGKDYGVGTGSSVNVELTTAAPVTTTDAAIQTELASLISKGTVPSPGNDASTNPKYIYFFFFPETTTIGSGNDQSCTAYGGYHSSTSNNEVYAVIPDCAIDTAITDLTDLQEVEIATSHELIEAATDPFPGTNPAYIITDSTSPWVGIGGEVGDICVYNAIGYPWGVAQRTWSNSAASAGNNSPCVPEINEPFYTVSLSPDSVTQVTSAGTVVKFTVTGWSNAPTQPFFAGPLVFSQGETGDAGISASMDVTELSNGKQGSLYINVPADDQNGDYIFMLDIANYPGGSSDIWNWYPAIVCYGANCAQSDQLIRGPRNGVGRPVAPR